MQLQYSESNYFSGVVENRMDPNMAGRVQVRVIGVHPFSRIQGDVEGIPIEDLPWMSVMMPANSASLNGVGAPNTGLMEGSHVFGLWLDKHRTNGIVLGTTTGKMLVPPNPDEGFSDPSGNNWSGNDTNPLGLGDESGWGSDANIYQDENRGYGLGPNGVPLSQQTPDNNPTMTMDQMLRRDEGVKNVLYWDTLGFPTIGIGHLIVPRKTRDPGVINSALSRKLGRSFSGSRPSITHDEILRLFNDDLSNVQSDMRKTRNIALALAKCNRSRQMALENMAFQMGVGGLAKFTNVLSLIAQGNFTQARIEMLKSKWARQTPGRAHRVALVILTGNLLSYGVRPATRSANMMVAAQSFTTPKVSDLWTDVDWADDAEPEDVLNLFTEPTSSYNGQYPYVHAYQSESGHIQEFDDTPGAERQRIRHPTGTYTEIAPDGRKTERVVGDQYNIVDGISNQSSSGIKRSNTGNLIDYTVGSIEQTVGGDCIVTIQANKTERVTGNLIIVVEGNADIQVKGNASVDVDGDYKMKVGGSLEWTIGGSVTQNVSGSWSQTMSSMNQNVSGQYTIAASRMDIQ